MFLDPIFMGGGGVEERLVLTGRTLTPPRECFRRKPVRQLPLSVMTPPVKRQFWKIRRFSRIAK